MRSDWIQLPLEDCMEAIIDYRGKTPKKTDSGIPLITAKIIKGGCIQPVTEYIAEEDYESWMRRGIPKNGDIVMTTEAPLGEVAQLDGRKVALAQRVITLRGKPGLLDNTFLKYLLSSRRIQHQLEGRATGTTVKGIKQSELRQVVLDFPSFDEQKAIAHILGTVDDKIELNRQMNETLEAMAQALFKSWFVDFDPVIDNALAAGNEIPEPLQKRAVARQALGDQRKPLPADIQSLFPDSFVFTDDMGWVPEGWGVKAFGEILEKTIGGDWGKEEPDEKHQKRVVIIRGTDIPSIKAGSLGSTPTRWVEEKKFKTRELVDGDIVIEVSGGSPKQPTGRSVYVTSSNLGMLGGSCVPASFCRRFRPINRYLGLFGALHLDYIYAIGKMWGYQNQSTGIANFQTPTFLETELLTLPMNEGLLENFYEIVRPMIDKCRTEENEYLSSLRDTLLPKLLSGELHIPDVEKQVSEAV